MFIPNPMLLAQPNIIKPLHGVNPRSILGQARRDRARQVCYASTDYHCAACGVHKKDAKVHQRLEAHEVYNVDFQKQEYTLKTLVPLCHLCHNTIHCGRLAILLADQQITEEFYEMVYRHANRVLPNVNEEREKLMREMCGGDLSLWFPEEDEGVWEKRHLLLKGEKHYSKLDTYSKRANYKRD